MRAPRKRTQPLAVALRRMGAKLEEWQVRPLILGAQASTNLSVGPQHLLGRIYGAQSMDGEDLTAAGAKLESLMEVWNQLILDYDQYRIRLSVVPREKHPTKEQLDALAARRSEEVIWFLRGLDAAGEDPEALGKDGEHLLRGLARGSAHLDSIRRLLERSDEAALQTARKQIDDITGVLERIIGNILTVGREIRGAMIDEMREKRDAEVDTSRSRPPTEAKVGRNAACPCGSGRKFKRCCGAPTRLH